MHIKFLPNSYFCLTCTGLSLLANIGLIFLWIASGKIIFFLLMKFFFISSILFAILFFYFFYKTLFNTDKINNSNKFLNHISSFLDQYSVKVLVFLIIFIYLLIPACVLSVIFSCKINESGYANEFNEIPGMPKDFFYERVMIENELYFSRKGYLSDYTLYIIGTFTPETTSILINALNDLGLPSPIFSYQNEQHINTFGLPLKNIPANMANKLKLRQEDRMYYSDIDDYLVFFKFSREKIHIEIYLFGKDGYFIISVT